MQLTRFTDYALRVLLFTARRSGYVCTMGEIATYYQISREHLRKVVHKMAKLGYLNSTRGRGGGLRLGRDPARIRIGDVVLAFENDLNIIDCQALNCRLQPGCSLKTALDSAGRAFIAALNEVTLADLLKDRSMQQQFKNIEIKVGRRTRVRARA
jgi:Rrf2 family nitric oxide-sensitive transcriptional repressor